MQTLLQTDYFEGGRVISNDNQEVKFEKVISKSGKKKVLGGNKSEYRSFSKKKQLLHIRQSN